MHMVEAATHVLLADRVSQSTCMNQVNCEISCLPFGGFLWGFENDNNTVELCSSSLTGDCTLYHMWTRTASSSNLIIFLPYGLHVCGFFGKLTADDE